MEIVKGLLIQEREERQIRAIIDEMPTKFGVALLNVFRAVKPQEYTLASGVIPVMENMGKMHDLEGELDEIAEMLGIKDRGVGDVAMHIRRTFFPTKLPPSLDAQG